jgi:phospholipid transport system substrate-binding protein
MRGKLMKGFQLKSLLVFPVIVFMTMAGTAQAQQTDPAEIIRSAASHLRDSLNGKQDYYSENLDELYKLIDDTLLPNFDIRYAGYLVLGKHWKSASEDQRTRFIDAFYSFLVRTYAKGLLEFDQEEIVFLPAEGSNDGKKTVVKTEVRMETGSRIPLNYSLRNSDGGWRIYDVRIEGISYVQNYRSQFNAEINAIGIDAVIERLERDTQAAESANQSVAEAT